MRALTQDDGTRVIAVYTEGLSGPDAFVEALAEAKRRRKPVVVLKGGASEPLSRFTFEVNPLKLGPDGVAAVDGLLIIE